MKEGSEALGGYSEAVVQHDFDLEAGNAET